MRDTRTGEGTTEREQRPGDAPADRGAAGATLEQLLEENRRLRAELARVGPLAEVGLLSAGAAHDLNNLLQLIAGHAAQLEPQSEAGRRILQRLTHATDSACELTLQLSRWGRPPVPQPGACDLAAAVRQVVELAESSAPEGARVRIEALEAPAWAAIDAHSAHRIVLNLLLNAWHALRGEPGEVVLRTGRRDAASVWAEVEDSGIGLDEAARERLFEPFFSADRTGGGLGLTTIRSLVDPLGGAIEVWSASGQGARFRVTLPAAPVSGSAPA